LAFLAAAVGLVALELGRLLPVLGFSADLAALRLDTDALIAFTLDVRTCMTMVQVQQAVVTQQAQAQHQPRAG
jgi:hypothetical protein